jgi:hypothetical protein
MKKITEYKKPTYPSIKTVEKIVANYLRNNGETEELALIIATSFRSAEVRTALENLGATRRRVNGVTSVDYSVFWSL